MLYYVLIIFITCLISNCLGVVSYSLTYDGCSTKRNETNQIIFNINETNKILEAQTNFTISCYGKKQLKWILPNMTEFTENFTRYEIKDTKVEIEDNDCHESQLSIYNISYSWNGNYSCLYSNSYDNDKQQDQNDKAIITIDVQNRTSFWHHSSKVTMIEIDSTTFILNKTMCRQPQQFTKVDLLMCKTPHFQDNRDCEKIHSSVSFDRSTRIFYSYLKCVYTLGHNSTTEILLLGKRDRRKMRVGCNNLDDIRFFRINSTFCVYPNISSTEQTVFWLIPNYDGILYANTKHLGTFVDADQKLNKVVLDSQDSGNYISYIKTPQGIEFTSIAIEILDTSDVFLDVQPQRDTHQIYYESNGTNVIDLIFTLRSYPTDAKVNWYNNRNEMIMLNNISKYEVLSNSSTTQLRIYNSSCEDSGIYTVKAHVNHVEKEGKIQLNVIQDRSAFLNVHVVYDFLNSKNVIKCVINSRPRAKMHWYFIPLKCSQAKCDATDLLEYFSQNLNYTRQESYLYAKDGVPGTYICVATNCFDRKNGTILSVTKDLSSIKVTWICFSFATKILTGVLIIGRWYWKKKRKSKEIQNAVIEETINNFHNGQINSLNPNVELNAQAEFLPYDKKWNVPWDHLHFIRKLGSGNYGIVMEADLKSLSPNGQLTRVAVKMPKSTCDNNYAQMLIKELKILIHIGTHKNIVNLLGACTENIFRNHIYVIYELCPFGNLMQILRKNQNEFLNLINPKSNDIDLSLMNTQQHSTVPVDCLKNEKQINISTKTLVEWSFQISEAMEFLSNKKILHGDLAARNVLLSDNNVVKVCDFGLSRNLYNNLNYCKKNKEALPIKWLAIETLQNYLFSTKSDVWSFGIVLWELFSLGATPYPNLVIDEYFFETIFNGYRMECPEFAPMAIYEIMLKCWQRDPELRPAFSITKYLIHDILFKVEHSLNP